MKKDKQSIKQGPELEYKQNAKMWNFTDGERNITIIPWSDTKKGNITEVYFKNKKEKKEFIIEFLETYFNQALFSPKDVVKTGETVNYICQRIMDVVITTTESTFSYALEDCIKSLMINYPMIKCTHVYYGIGEFFGIERYFGTLKKIDAIPSRSMKYPGSRMDSID